MKLFLKNIFLFVICTLTLFGTFTIYNRYFTFSSNYFKLDENIQYLIVGDSHVECAINGSFEKSTNIGQSGEVYIHSYYKIKKTLEANKQIKTIFIDFCNIQVNIKQDSIFLDTPYLIKRYKPYFPLYSKQDLVYIYKQNPMGFVKAHFKSLPINFYHSFTNVSIDDENYLGGYQLLTEKLNSDKNLNNHLAINSSDLQNQVISNYNLIYLDKILNLCNQLNVKVYFIRTPLNENWKFLGNEHLFQKVKSDKYGRQELLDFKDFPFDASEFADFEHLNSNGADKFSNFLSFLIKNDLLKKTNKQEFIDFQIKQYK
jgi:hypothetical protein